MTLPVNAQPGGVFDPSRDIVTSAQIRTSAPAPSGGIGYATGAGGTVTQITNRSTAVTVNALCGTITTDNTSLAAEAAAAFIVRNSCVDIGDVVVLSIRSGVVGAMTVASVNAVAAGTFTVNILNNNAAAGVAETGAIVLNFLVLKGTTT